MALICSPLRGNISFGMKFHLVRSPSSAAMTACCRCSGVRLSRNLAAAAVIEDAAGGETNRAAASDAVSTPIDRITRGDETIDTRTSGARVYLLRTRRFVRGRDF